MAESKSIHCINDQSRYRAATPRCAAGTDTAMARRLQSQRRMTPSANAPYSAGFVDSVALYAGTGLAQSANAFNARQPILSDTVELGNAMTRLSIGNASRKLAGC
jgi:hypothetical protein